MNILMKGGKSNFFKLLSKQSQTSRFFWRLTSNQPSTGVYKDPAPEPSDAERPPQPHTPGSTATGDNEGGEHKAWNLSQEATSTFPSRKTS